MFLDRIVTQTSLDLEQRKRDYPLEDLKRLAHEQPRARDFAQAFEPRTQVHLIAEVKRASPSKGMLLPDFTSSTPVELARTYEANGASVISVLTEPHFFLGAPEYLTAIKHAVNIPVLRKDFIIDEYQVYEARAWGADAILLICAILDDAQLRHLYSVARELNMHCLVEVHSPEEAQRAVEARALVIGVNSRDLVTFKMNPYLIRDIRQQIPPDRIVIAESGIHSAADARRLARYDVQGMLVGESLVVSKDIPTQIQMLLRGANVGTQVKVCGLREAEHITVAMEAGADLLGFIFYPPSHRYIRPEQVRKAVEASGYYERTTASPDLVGVFVNEKADFINEAAEEAGLHYVQLHGDESLEFCQHIKRPVIKALSVRTSEDLARLQEYRAVVWRLLLDTPTPQRGGSGVTSDWELARQAARELRIFLAGGLNAENVGEAIERVRPWGLDVSSGVESDKHKDPEKIRRFLRSVREIQMTQEGLY
ncbi:bifunctional indole-3-glycerol-phosphate synthase TrpC/phosphoribosylanthranilate isomerase TrpF [Ktedonospora formicarum]|uniref:Multifunctional fusion protein n=1 Tax=Ktedonospora formicarum TaxID=2778364 RepID=A0A8J3I3Z8_9CHLR|nr:bifunctional indole-3-glycerol-phosphate synthase TrpC/phosphoribosylanthranilate isomerase TrpF [Ktedonospora formicarum]GHO45558.1 bifunctional indole-3-glycerol phosphate synthase/phosphoribosylanthranilate isomerase [Ktedonospora formicarum]